MIDDTRDFARSAVKAAVRAHIAEDFSAVERCMAAAELAVHVESEPDYVFSTLDKATVAAVARYS